MKILFPSVLLVFCAIFSGAVWAAQSTQITSLDHLLRKVKQQQAEERALNQKREAEFIAKRDEQKTLLRKAEAEFLKAQKQNNPLKRLTDANRKEIKNLEAELKEEVNNLGDVYGIYREFSGDITAVLQESLIQAQLPERQAQLNKLNSGEELPTIEEMKELWLLVQEEMTEASKVRTFTAPVLNAKGEGREQLVLRAGTFTAVSDGQLLRYIPETGELLTLSRQPSERAIAADFSDAYPVSEPRSMIIDPTRGSLLGMTANLPTLGEKIQQGKAVGKVIISIGVVGLLIVLWRIGFLLTVWLATRKQLKHLNTLSTGNPLGRVLQSVNGLQGTSEGDEEALQYRLDEAILQELPRLERGHSLIKLFAAVAPLLGLLGTVIGMIATFQAIALFGSGDPKLMAGGISQALVTTVLGLVVAIPLLFGHNMVASLSRSIVQVLDEQSAGLLAEFLENKKS